MKSNHLFAFRVLVFLVIAIAMASYADDAPRGGTPTTEKDLSSAPEESRHNISIESRAIRADAEQRATDLRTAPLDPVAVTSNLNYSSTTVVTALYGDGNAEVGYTYADGQYYVPQSFDIDQNDNVYVLDSDGKHDRILIFRKDGIFDRSFSIVPVGPDDIRIREDGALFLLDNGTRRVFQYAIDGEPREMFELPAEITRIYGYLAFDHQGRPMFMSMESDPDEGQKYSLYHIGSDGGEGDAWRIAGYPATDGREFYSFKHIDAQTGRIRIRSNDGNVVKDVNIAYPDGLTPPGYRNPTSALFLGVDNSSNFYVRLLVDRTPRGAGQWQRFDQYLLKYNNGGRLVVAIPIVPPKQRELRIKNDLRFSHVEWRVQPSGDVYHLFSLLDGIHIVRYSFGEQEK